MTPQKGSLNSPYPPGTDFSAANRTTETTPYSIDACCCCKSRCHDPASLPHPLGQHQQQFHEVPIIASAHASLRSAMASLQRNRRRGRGLPLLRRLPRHPPSGLTSRWSALSQPSPNHLRRCLLQGLKHPKDHQG
jgi:hypothetical protein